MTTTTILFGIFLTLLANFLRALVVSSNQRFDILENNHTNGIILGEFKEVTLASHFWRVFFFRSPASLYGPLCQCMLMSGTLGHLAGNEYFWEVYNKVYRVQGERTRRDINKNLAKAMPHNLPMVMDTMGFDVSHGLLFGDCDKVPKYAMEDGAAEYEEIMRMQELGNA